MNTGAHVNDYMEEATKAFRWIERTRPPGSNKISLTFGAKGSYVPLQAADVVAYEANHVLRDPDKPRRPSWNAIDPDGSHISLKHYGRKNMGTLIDVLSMRRAQLLASGWDGQVE